MLLVRPSRDYWSCSRPQVTRPVVLSPSASIFFAFEWYQLCSSYCLYCVLCSKTWVTRLVACPSACRCGTQLPRNEFRKRQCAGHVWDSDLGQCRRRTLQWLFKFSRLEVNSWLECSKRSSVPRTTPWRTVGREGFTIKGILNISPNGPSTQAEQNKEKKHEQMTAFYCYNIVTIPIQQHSRNGTTTADH